MPTDSSNSLEVSSCIAELAKHANAGIARLTGFVGPSEPSKIRLYQSLAMDAYVEVSRDSILRVEAGTEDPPKVVIYVPKSTQTLVVRVDSLTTTADTVPGVIFLSGRDTVEKRCKVYGAGLDMLGAAMGLMEVVESVTGQDVKGTKDEIAAAQNDLEDRRKALGCEPL